ncbi:hypothetical protein ACFQ9J_16600 [Streptomyces sp. NPDC056529]|uniref:hypothetical protein n=1 Tax=Streptomyces sp. NPDC056529 TaxID=3345855 RepID=UPI00369B238F
MILKTWLLVAQAYLALSWWSCFVQRSAAQGARFTGETVLPHRRRSMPVFARKFVLF